MKLLDSLYRILPDAQEAHAVPADGTAIYTVALNAEHGIYKAHFPGNPITPGVCLVQMAVELLSLHLGESLRLTCLGSTKFLKPVLPLEAGKVTFAIGYEKTGLAYSLNVTVTDGNAVCARIKLVCNKY